MEKAQELASLEDLEDALRESSGRLVLIFKHSESCSISARAFREFESYLAGADPRVAHKLIVVQIARGVSDLAADRLGVVHETPQAILVHDGREVWNASHYDITSTALSEAVRRSQT